MRGKSNGFKIFLMAILLILPIVLGALIGLLVSEQVPTAEPQQTEPTSKNLSLSQQEVTFNIGSARTLTADVADASGSYIFQWTTSDKSIVSVKKDSEAQNSCQLTAEGEGSATVTASIIDITKFKVVESVSCVVNVTDEQIDFGVDEVIISLDKGNTAEVEAVAPDGGEITWLSEDESIATAADGVITAHKAGQVYLTARSGNVESKLLVKVYNSFFTLEEVKIVTAGKSDTIAVDGSISGNAVWASGDDRVATVDGNGVVRGVRTGMTTVTAESETDGLTSTCVVIVKSGSDKPVQLGAGTKSAAAKDPGNWFYLCESEEVSVSAVPVFDNGVICADITAIGDSGSNFFYLRYQPDEIGDVIYSTTIYIYSDTDHVPVQINGTDYELMAGLNRIEMEYTSAEPKDGNPYQIKWKGMGQFYVIPVFEEVGRIAKMTLSDEYVILNTTEEKTVSLTATVPSQGSYAIQWASSNEAVATVSDGVVTAVGEGSSMITAQCGPLSAKCLVTVEGETPIAGEELAKGNKSAALEVPGQWFYLKDGKSALYTNPIMDGDGAIHLAIDEIDDANKKYVYLRYQPDHVANYKATITIEFAGAEGANVEIRGGNVGATPITLHNGTNTVEFAFTSDDAAPFQFKFYDAGSYVIHVTLREE